MKIIILIVIVVTVLFGTLLVKHANGLQAQRQAVINELLGEMK